VGRLERGLTVKGRGKLADAADNRVLVRQIQQCVALGAERHGTARGHRCVEGGVGRRRGLRLWFGGGGGEVRAGFSRELLTNKYEEPGTVYT
jgi:hypothetical protein